MSLAFGETFEHLGTHDRNFGATRFYQRYNLLIYQPSFDGVYFQAFNGDCHQGPLLDMTTMAHGYFHRWDFHPLDAQLDSLHKVLFRC
jgi:hypothetical protein